MLAAEPVRQAFHVFPQCPGVKYALACVSAWPAACQASRRTCAAWVAAVTPEGRQPRPLRPARLLRQTGQGEDVCSLAERPGARRPSMSARPVSDVQVGLQHVRVEANRAPAAAIWCATGRRNPFRAVPAPPGSLSITGSASRAWQGCATVPRDPVGVLPPGPVIG